MRVIDWVDSHSDLQKRIFSSHIAGKQAVNTALTHFQQLCDEFQPNSQSSFSSVFVLHHLLSKMFDSLITKCHVDQLIANFFRLLSGAEQVALESTFSVFSDHNFYGENEARGIQLASICIHITRFH